jgi:hypothetical protein
MGVYTVYEIINQSRREILVGLTSDPRVDAVASVRAVKPAIVEHWQHSDDLRFRGLESGVTPDAALSRAASYAQAVPPAGWRYLLGT